SLSVDDRERGVTRRAANSHGVEEIVAVGFRLSNGKRRSWPVYIPVSDPNPLSIQSPQDLAAARGVSGREVHDRLPEQIVLVARLQRRSPLLSKGLAALLENLHESLRITGGGTVLAMNQRHTSADDRPKSLLPRAKRVVRVLEVRLVILRQGADLFDQLTAKIDTGKNDALHFSGGAVLADVLLQGSQ